LETNNYRDLRKDLKVKGRVFRSRSDNTAVLLQHMRDTNFVSQCHSEHLVRNLPQQPRHQPVARGTSSPCAMPTDSQPGS
jgi:hypothetical protein